MYIIIREMHSIACSHTNTNKIIYNVCTLHPKNKLDIAKQERPPRFDIDIEEKLPALST